MSHICNPNNPLFHYISHNVFIHSYLINEIHVSQNKLFSKLSKIKWLHGFEWDSCKLCRTYPSMFSVHLIVKKIYIFYYNVEHFIRCYSWIYEIHRMATKFSIFNLSSEKYYITVSYCKCEISFYSITTIGNVDIPYFHWMHGIKLRH